MKGKIKKLFGERMLLIDSGVCIDIETFSDLYAGVADLTYKSFMEMNVQKQYGHGKLLERCKYEGLLK